MSVYQQAQQYINEHHKTDARIIAGGFWNPSSKPTYLKSTLPTTTMHHQQARVATPFWPLPSHSQTLNQPLCPIKTTTFLHQNSQSHSAHLMLLENNISHRTQSAFPAAAITASIQLEMRQEAADYERKEKLHDDDVLGRWARIWSDDLFWLEVWKGNCEYVELAVAEGVFEKLWREIMGEARHAEHASSEGSWSFRDVTPRMESVGASAQRHLGGNDNEASGAKLFAGATTPDTWELDLSSHTGSVLVTSAAANSGPPIQDPRDTTPRARHITFSKKPITQPNRTSLLTQTLILEQASLQGPHESTLENTEYPTDIASAVLIGTGPYAYVDHRSQSSRSLSLPSCSTYLSVACPRPPPTPPRRHPARAAEGSVRQQRSRIAFADELEPAVASASRNTRQENVDPTVLVESLCELQTSLSNDPTWGANITRYAIELRIIGDFVPETVPCSPLMPPSRMSRTSSSRRGVWGRVKAGLRKLGRLGG